MYLTVCILIKFSMQEPLKEIERDGINFLIERTP